MSGLRELASPACPGCHGCGVESDGCDNHLCDCVRLCPECGEPAGDECEACGAAACDECGDLARLDGGLCGVCAKACSSCGEPAGFVGERLCWACAPESLRRDERAADAADARRA